MLKIFAGIFCLLTFAAACAFTGFAGTVYVLEHFPQ